MKFWYVFSKNPMDQGGRFVFEVGNAETEIYDASAERTETLASANAELNDLATTVAINDFLALLSDNNDANLQTNFLAGRPITIGELMEFNPSLTEDIAVNLIEELQNIPFPERLTHVPPAIINRLILINTNIAAELLHENPAVIKNLDTACVMTLLQRFSLNETIDDDQKAIIINQLNPSDLIFFISTNPDLIHKLCTRVVGQTATVNFFGNTTLNREVASALLFPQTPYIRAETDQATYRSTGYGFRSFYQRTRSLSEVWSSREAYNRAVEINQKAFAVDGSVFQLVDSHKSLNKEEKLALASLTEEQILETPTTPSADFAINQAYALNFKMLASNLVSNISPEISPKISGDIHTQAQALRIFLDGRRFLLPGQLPTNEAYTQSAISGLAPIDYNQTPAEVQEAAGEAMKLILAHFTRQIEERQAQITNTKLRTKERTTLQSELDELISVFTHVGGSLETLRTGMQEDLEAVRIQSTESITNQLENCGFSPEEISVYWERLQAATTTEEGNAIVNEIGASAAAKLTAAGVSQVSVVVDNLKRDLLTHIRYKDAVDQGTILTESLRRPQAIREYIDTNISPVIEILTQAGLYSRLPAPILIAISTGQIDAMVVNQLDIFIEQNRKAIENYLATPEGRNASETSTLQLFFEEDAGAHYANYMRTVNADIADVVDEATQRRTERAPMVADAIRQIETYFNPNGTRRTETPEQQSYWQGQDIRREAYTNYYSQHGEFPPPEIQAQIEQIITLQTNPQFANLSLEQKTLAYQSLNTIPTGTNFEGVTADGDLIISSSGPDQTRFIQSPSDGRIIAEHLTGVPDSEDLRVPANEWATAQALAVMTDGFVIKGADELAQAGEALGNRALVNFMRQYWGIRGNNTLPESELDKFKSLGEMMSANFINLHTVLAQLNALKWDNTADGSRALNIRNQFNEILEAATAGNNNRFRALLRLDDLPR